jgi:N-methylhydantoinase A
VTVSIGIDVGGTFTDLVAVSLEDGSARSGKVLSTPHDQSLGVEVALGGQAWAGTVARIVHGTTVVTNMLLERRGARVVLCATRGATDLLELRRQERASLYDLSVHHPAPLVGPGQVVAVHERMTPAGVADPLTDAEADQAAEQVAALAPDIVAISLLHAYALPGHELQLADAIARRLPGVDVVRSSEVLPEIREYERTATTVCEAYARPGVRVYLENLSGRVAALGMPAPGVVSSSGGMRAAADAARHAASLALSGPAGGVAGAALVARLAGFDRALSIDIGGTSADVGLILDAEPLVEAGGQVAGVPIALPRVLVETVSAGGGSLGWVDDGGALRVGPRSAGALPGPVAFGRGGTQATVTDAHVVLGNIRAERMGGEVRLDADGARAAVARLAATLGASPERTAEAMIATADAEMARALRRVSVERGIDPRGCVLVAFGGGGPLHACALAERLGMTRVLVPPHAGVLSALGLAVAPERRVGMVSVLRPLGALASVEMLQLADQATRRAGLGAPDAAGAGSRSPSAPSASDEVERRVVARLRYRGQGHELEVPVLEGDDVVRVRERFEAAHQRRYGFVLELDIEMVSLRATLSSRPPALHLRRSGVPAWDPVAMVDAGAPLDATVRGPAVITLPDATLRVAAGWGARALPMGGWLLESAT